MKYPVLLTRDARNDLEDIYDYIAAADSSQQAEVRLGELNEALASLSHFPERGACPYELQEMGIRTFRQNFLKPYRIIYQVIEKQVIVFLIADGRRDMQTLLLRRLLGGSPPEGKLF